MRLRTFLAVAGLTVCFASVASAQEPAPETQDLVKLGESLLPSDDPKPRAAVAPAGGDAATAATAATAAPADAGVDLDLDADDAGDAGPDDAGLDDDAAAMAAPLADERSDGGDALASSNDDAGGVAASTKAQGVAPVGVGPSARRARIASGQNSELKSLDESPIAKLGVPEQAVPVVATAAAVGTTAVWPIVIKTLTGLLKKLLAALIKRRAKKGKTIEKEQKRVNILGFDLRPVELGSLLLGALIYGFAVCYSFQGRGLTPSFLVSQEALVVALYYSRSFVRFGYERRYKLPTQFKLWVGGGVLCLVSTYLGSTLGTVGYEVEETTSKEDAERIVKMKAMLTTLALVMALGFFVANVLHPTQVLQSGRLMLSGMALGEILPITPMPGKKIFDWNKGVWALMAVTIVPTFVLINYVL